MFDIHNGFKSELNLNLQSKLETERKIKSFAQKPVGWHYGQGRPPSAKRVGMALAYLSVLEALDLSQTDAFPGIDGEVMVRAYKEDACFSLSIEVNYMTTLSIDVPNKEDFEEENLPISRAITLLVIKLGEVLKKECDTHDSLTLSTMTKGQNLLLTMPLKIVPTAVAHLSSARNALTPAADLYASTLGTTTQISPPIRQYSGHSTRLYSETLAA